MKQLLNRFREEESGATAIEYGLIAALIAVAIIGGVSIIGTRLDVYFDSIATALGGSPT